MSKLHTIKKNFFSLAFAEIVTKAIGALLYMVLARYLGPSEFGIYSIAISFVTIFSIIANLGVDPFLVKEIARDPVKTAPLLQSAVTIKLLGSLTSYIAILSCIIFLPYNHITKSAILVFSFTIFFRAINDLFDSIYRGTQRMEMCALMRISRSCITVAIIFLFILFKKDILWITASHPITGLILLSYFYAFSIRGTFFTFSFSYNIENLKNLIWQSLPFLTLGVIHIISAKTDVIMLSFFTTTKDVGLYDAANQIILILLVLPSIVSQVLYPYMSKQYGQSRHGITRSVNLTTRYLSFIGIPTSILIFFGSEQIILRLYGNEFSTSFNILRVMSVGVSIAFIRSILSWVLVAIDKVNLMMKFGLVTLSLNILINFILIPIYGAVGAAIATVISMFITTTSILILLKKDLPEINPILNIYFKPICAGLAMAVTLYFLQSSNIILSTVISCLIYSIIFIAIKGFSVEEKKLIYRVIRDKKGVSK